MNAAPKQCFRGKTTLTLDDFLQIMQLAAELSISNLLLMLESKLTGLEILLNGSYKNLKFIPKEIDLQL